MESNYIWTDSPTAKDPLIRLKNFSSFEKSTEFEAQANLLEQYAKRPKYPENLRKLFYFVMKIKENLTCNLYAKSPKSEPESAVIIQTWWRKVSKSLNLSKRQKNAVCKIEAWWIGTVLRRKIRVALAKVSQTTLEIDNFEVDEDFDLENFTSEIDSIEQKSKKLDGAPGPIKSVSFAFEAKKTPLPPITPPVNRTRSINSGQ